MFNFFKNKDKATASTAMADNSLEAQLNQVDVCFVIDTTGSMGGFINAAKAQLLKVLERLSANNDINLQIGLVEYRDHPPQDKSFVTRIYPLTADLKKMQMNINKLQPSGGGDAPEAVYQGVFDACKKMQWRTHSCRFALLVGDAPPHAFAAWLKEVTGGAESFASHGDSWANQCPSGLDVYSVTAAAEENRVKVYGLAMTTPAAQVPFEVMAKMTGGECFLNNRGDGVIQKIEAILKGEFDHIYFDQKVLEVLTAMETDDNDFEVEGLAERLEVAVNDVVASVSRLGKRGFLS
ncbi:MAG: VWA domain-containing protein [Chitinophagales bacterium]